MKRIWSFFARIGRFFWSGRFLKIVLWTVTLVALFYTEEDWRGPRAWAATKAKWEARGETFDINRLIPPPIPDEQSLAALPIFQMEPDPKGRPPGTLTPLTLRQAMRNGLPGEEVLQITFGRWQSGHLPPLTQFQTALAGAYREVFHAESSASALSQFDALFPCVNHLKAAAVARPVWRPNPRTLFNWPYNFSLFTDQVPFTRVVTWHAILALDEHQPEAASGDIALNDEIAAGLSDQPVLATGLCAIGVRTVNLCAIYNGIVLHAWTDEQLVELESRLGRIDYLATFQQDIRGECLLAVDSWTRFYPPLWPRGWASLHGTHLVNFELGMIPLVDAKSHLVSVRSLNAKLNPHDRWKAFLPLDSLLPQAGQIFARAAQHFAEAQVWNDEARMACALERYRLSHHAYPDSLEALVPREIDELPHDIMNGQAYHYKLRPNGTFLLYSVGWNQKDDGGQRAFERDHPAYIDYEQGDWVWPTPK